MISGFVNLIIASSGCTHLVVIQFNYFTIVNKQINAFTQNRLFFTNYVNLELNGSKYRHLEISQWLLLFKKALEFSSNWLFYNFLSFLESTLKCGKRLKNIFFSKPNIYFISRLTDREWERDAIFKFRIPLKGKLWNEMKWNDHHGGKTNHFHLSFPPTVCPVAIGLNWPSVWFASLFFSLGWNVQRRNVKHKKINNRDWSKLIET